MVIDKDDPALQFLRCYDRDDNPLAVSAFQLRDAMGYFAGQAVPVADYEFVVPENSPTVKQRLKEYLGPEYADRVRSADQPRKPKTVSIMANFIRVSGGPQ